MLSTALTRTNFDSASLSALASIAHPIRERGHWRLESQGRRGSISAMDIIVRDGGKSRLTVDIARPVADTNYCDADEQFLAPDGMLNLNADAVRDGFFALLYGPRGDEPLWDSRLLEPGDHYACMPLRPGDYLVSNLLGDARASVRVNYPDLRATARGHRLASGPVHFQIDEAIIPGEQRLDPGQMLVFAIGSRSHLSIELRAADDGPTDLAEWRAARSRDALNAAFRSADRRK